MTSSIHSHQWHGSTGRDPYSSPVIYYADEHLPKPSVAGRARATSHWFKNRPTSSPLRDQACHPGRRRNSLDEHPAQSQTLIIDVARTLQDLIDGEDINGDQQITIDDHGPKHISLGTLSSEGYRTTDVRGQYMISNLLQELTLAQDLNKKTVIMDRARLSENPVNRLSRRIKHEFWKNLERVLDSTAIEKAGRDPKDWTDDPRPRIYIPHGAPEQFEHYAQYAKSHPEVRLDVQMLPEGGATPELVRDLNKKPGILALAMYRVKIDGQEELRGQPFIVPGGRFNELYGWDSYMESIGLLENDRVDLAKSMVINFAFCIQHYGKILNANRSYYLCRSQPPFLTDMSLRVYEKIRHEPDAREFLHHATQAAIKEYYNVWMSAPRYDAETGLSRYRPDGLGVPPETEASHFVHILAPYVAKRGMTMEEYVEAYNQGQITEPELDEYFLHDRAVRESGHDTSYRLEGIAANLATVDLNSLLYKYEMDIARIIREHFNNKIIISREFQTEQNRSAGYETSEVWEHRAKTRQSRMNAYMWDDNRGAFFDYDTVKEERTTYESATTFWPMWAGLATSSQAASLVTKALPLLECLGGLASGTEESRGEVGVSRPNRQWDYPFGWAPHQMLAWKGLQDYGYNEEVRRLAYKWLYMVTKAFVDFNGVIVEKYNVTNPCDPHKVDAEYGNQGSDFKGVPREGFGWVNASYVYGLSLVPQHMKRALGTLTPWETFNRATTMKTSNGRTMVTKTPEVSRDSSTDDDGPMI